MFELVLGKESPIRPGSAWTQYSVEVLPNKMVCVAKKGATAKVEIYYSSFKSAEFGIGNGNFSRNFCNSLSHLYDSKRTFVKTIQEYVPVT